MVNKHNWQAVCDRMEIKRRYIINKYDTNYFFIASLYENKAKQILFWPLKTVAQKKFAKYIYKLLWVENQMELVIWCGYQKWTDLRELIDNDLLALKMGANILFTTFEFKRELACCDFPKINNECAKKHIEWTSILRKGHHCCQQPDQILNNIISDLFDIVHFHNNEKCVANKNHMLSRLFGYK